MVEIEHALESLYRGRDALGQALSAQSAGPGPSLDELHAFGTVIVSVLAQLGQLSSVLAEQVENFDEQELARAKTADHPENEIKVAAGHLSQLSVQLNAAVSEAAGYWSSMRSVDRNTREDRRPGE